MQNAQPECAGVCRIIKDLAKTAPQHGYEFAVLFLGDGPLRERLSDAGISAHVIRWEGTFADVGGAVRVRSWLKRNRPEIVHLHWGGRAVRGIGQLSGARLVVQHIHGRIDEVTGVIAKPLHFPWVDALVACSNSVANDVTGNKVEVIYPGIDVSENPLPISTSTGPLKIGVLSRLTYAKNIEAVITAAARLNDRSIDVSVEIAGRGPSESALRNCANEFGISDRVHFLGWREETEELLQSWDLVVMPSLDEGFGLAALEAMAAARPVIVSRVGGLAEIVIDGVTGYLMPPRDTGALADCLAEFATDRAKLARMGLAGWERAKAEFSIESSALRMFDYYGRLLKEPGVTQA